MSGWFSTIWSFLLLCTSSLIIMPVKYMREIMENFQVKTTTTLDVRLRDKFNIYLVNTYKYTYVAKLAAKLHTQ